VRGETPDREIFIYCGRWFAGFDSPPPQENHAMSNVSDLKTHGLKVTTPRLRILRLFETSKVRHLSAEEIYRLLTSEGVDIGLATVYRVLTQFEQAGILQRHHFESDKAVFELNEGEHHDHLVCLQCGHVEEFFDAEIERRQTQIATDRGFSLHAHSLSLYADCNKPDCGIRKKLR
jgi:Fur family transcriptional regulator, ferric uptake regulator